MKNKVLKFSIAATLIALSAPAHAADMGGTVGGFSFSFGDAPIFHPVPPAPIFQQTAMQTQMLDSRVQAVNDAQHRSIPNIALQNLEPAAGGISYNANSMNFDPRWDAGRISYDTAGNIILK